MVSQQLRLCSEISGYLPFNPLCQGACMDTNPLFTAALGLVPPWQATKTDFDPALRDLRMRVDFRKGATFSCPTCQAAGCRVHDMIEKEWPHMNFFQHKAFINARVQHINCGACGVHQAAVP